MTLQTIADRLGISRMTVSNAFSRPDQLSDGLRRRILAAADELGYVGPIPRPARLARGSSGAVGILLTDSLKYAFTDEVATNFLGAVADELAPSGRALTLLSTNAHDDVVPARDLALDAALVYSCSDSPARDWLIRRRLPLVLVDQDPLPGVPSVNVDDRGGARMAAQHVIELGHERVGIVTVALDGSRGLVDPRAPVRGHPQRQRMLGWLETLEAAGILPTVVQVSSNTDDEADQAAHTLLATADLPTAVLCFSDVLALGVMRVARELGLTVPGHLSVVGFDDSPAAHRSTPRLTTVRQDVAAKGRLAAEAVIGAIEAAAVGSPPARARHRVLPTELIVRDSTARSEPR